MAVPKVTSQGQDAAASSEYFSELCERQYRRNASRRLAIVFPGGTGNNRAFLDLDAQAKHLHRALAAVGWPVASADLAGGSQWANDATQDRIPKLISKAQGDLNTKTDAVIGIGLSQGVPALLRYERDHPGTFAAIVSIVGALPIDTIHDQNRSGLAAAINTAWTNSSTWETRKADADPFLNFGEHDLPILDMAADGDDGVTLFSEHETFAAAESDVTLVNLGAVGHTGATVDVDMVRDFLEEYRG